MWSTKFPTHSQTGTSFFSKQRWRSCDTERCSEIQRQFGNGEKRSGEDTQFQNQEGEIAVSNKGVLFELLLILISLFRLALGKLLTVIFTDFSRGKLMWKAILFTFDVVLLEGLKWASDSMMLITYICLYLPQERLFIGKLHEAFCKGVYVNKNLWLDIF